MEDKRPTPEMFLARLQQEEQTKGKLKIFLGYAAGVGKTYAMLDAAHQAQKLGKDVVVGYVEPHPRPETLALLEGLEQIPTKIIAYKGKIFQELDIDAVLQRQPEIVLIDELAHSNVPTMRHKKRFGDVEELLAKGIHVFTTVNIQHIESLHDLVEEITEIKVRERIPDYLIDQAAQIKVVDIEPDELIQRLQDGKVYVKQQAEKALHSFFRRQNLVSLREIALRRTADTINYQQLNSNESVRNYVQIEEHLLVGISSSPTNAKVIRTTARLAQALHGKFTALYVQNMQAHERNHADSERLQQHIKLVEQLGGHVVIVQEDDVAAALANYAQVSGVTKLVIGRTSMRKKWWQPNTKISDRLNEYVPNLSIHIVPDQENEQFYFPSIKNKLAFEWLDLFKMFIVFSVISIVGLYLYSIDISEPNIITIYILGVLILAIWSSGWIMSIISSIVAVLLFNYLFTEPRFSFDAYHRDYPMTFFIMFLSGVITSSLTKKIKAQTTIAIRKSYRMEVLLETNRRLQHAKSIEEIITEGMTQIVKLVEKPVQFFEIDNQVIGKSTFFRTEKISAIENQKIATLFNNPNEHGVVSWVTNNKHVAGVSTDIFPEVSAYYIPVISNSHVKGVIGIALSKLLPLPAFERNILHAIINDFSFAMDKWYLQKLNEEVAREAEMEQMRANLLRAISHDLRTPLTAISGNADILLNNASLIPDSEKNKLYEDIFNNSKWLVQMVENLLAVSKLEDGQFALEMQMVSRRYYSRGSFPCCSPKQFS
ncbi:MULTISPECIES: sensor histidine kinase KdpD [unclassified Lysinibacillus]|uniref:sensor histidine kinase n=1 Tax=unclassified Lysinibacillus TaxID=2636778 RepID=UPI00088D8BB7|nr:MULTISPECIES: sensor histidine kinase KdpD [unclassified Lysinibacillus]SCY75837.1 two-component system, OmpR family, sensor histidine kinase KdpD [Lysinibacillus sp. SG9]SDB33687.1 two-component system, OmpR family, sensor histidine kinase KdpD [Lysinibacillus sp. TC-37]SFS96118.1 two-component system, OmpR family, sensor histidine kinase KdpD [Lysinibacillus sp. SG55]